MHFMGKNRFQVVSLVLDWHHFFFSRVILFLKGVYISPIDISSHQVGLNRRFYAPLR